MKLPNPRPGPFLDPELVEIVRNAAASIPVAARQRFYEAVDRALRGAVLGPGTVARACRAAQAEFVAIDDASPAVDGRQ